MAHMDLSDSQIFGDEIDIWVSTPDSSTEESEKATGRTKKKKIDAQDRLVWLQAMLAVVVLLLFLAVKFVFPKLHETLNEQYVSFNAKPPIFDLEDIKRLVTPEEALALPEQTVQENPGLLPAAQSDGALC